MNISRTLVALLLALGFSRLVAAEDNAAVPSAHDMLKARLAEETKPGQPKPVAAPITPTATQAVANANGGDKSPLLTATAAPAPQADSAAAAKAQPPTVLPPMEVNKARITKLDQELAKEDLQIAREKKNAKPTEVDKALNDAKIAKPLAIFGGESAQFRQRVSNGRVSLMEDEKDILEAIAHAKTKEEKAELQKQLDALRAERRQLEQALR